MRAVTVFRVFNFPITKFYPGFSIRPMTPHETLSRIESSPLYNEDLAPARAERRHWGTYNFAALWISMSVNILTYMLAASLIQGGMNWKQAVATIFVGNVIVLAPMLLNSHPGAKYGIPFPVLARASFGVLGANVAAMLRALVACGWFGIQAWIGGEAISTLLATLAPRMEELSPMGPAFAFSFLADQPRVMLKGIEYIRILQGISAPVCWASDYCSWDGPIMPPAASVQCSPCLRRFTPFSDFLKFLIPALNGTVGFWATVSLEYSRLHAIRTQPARAGDRAGIGPADHDDALCFYRHRSDLGHSGDLRDRNLGSGAASQPLSFPWQW
jgi:cytosine/uracil/thiamine/allantoin permease